MDSGAASTRRVTSGGSLTGLLTLHSVRVTCTAGSDRGKEWLVESPTARIGSGEAAEVRLSDFTVSRMHAQLKQTPGGWMVEDLASTNGVVLDGVKVASAYLRQGSTLTLGDTTLGITPREQAVLARPSGSDRFGAVLGNSPAMREVFGMLERVAPLQVSVLLSGPTGSGKGALARAIHQASPRAKGRFAVLDCANVDPQLIRAELFGHEKGAFTGAESARVGLFESAAGGTVFIDELGELPLDLQPRLLRVLEDREVTRLGAQQPVPVDVRVVAATHRDMRRLVVEGKFREDLFYRLCVVELEVPPLARRTQDIPLLAAHVLEQLGADHRLPLAPEVIHALCTHTWPGNVRELRNALERGVAMAGAGRLAVSHLRLPPLGAAPGAATAAPAAPPVVPGMPSLAEAEKEAIERALRSAGGNRMAAARQLNIAVTTLRRKMKEFGME